MTDRQIIERLNNRDESGIEETQRQYGPRLIRIAETLLSKEDAEECVNDVYLALWNHVPQDESTTLMPYLVTILKNFARMRWRAEKTGKRRMERISLFEDTEISDPRSNTEEEAILSATNTLNRFLTRQKPVRREMFMLRYWYGLSVKEIAERYDCSISKVEKTLTRMKNAVTAEIKAGV